MLQETITIVLAGGAGSRLQPLTMHRAKPAVPFGGKYRIIDFTLANCLHSGLRRVLVLTQYKSHSLQKHLRDGWSIFNPELGEYITSVPAQMREGEKWYQGTADAIWQNRYILERSGAKYVLVLSGDHIYRMDYAAMLLAHQQKNAEVSIACMEVKLADARAFGVIGVDDNDRIVHFHEKPNLPTPLTKNPDYALVSMGVYVFSLSLLLQCLREDAENANSSHDFGKDLLPQLIYTHAVYGHRFGNATSRVSQDRYWRDVGTLDSYYEANMDLLKPVPPLDLYQVDWPIRTHELQVPPARTVPGKSGDEGISINSIMGGGTVISGACVQNSILFPKVYVGDEALVEESILFEGVRIGANAKIRRVIIDKNVQVPAGVQLGYDQKLDERYFPRSEGGVIVVPKQFDFAAYLADFNRR